MCRKLLILCFALVVIAMSTPVSAAPSTATPLYIDFNGGGSTQTQAGWEGWNFDFSPTTNTFSKSFTVGGSKVAVELKGVKNDGSNPASRNRDDQPTYDLGDMHQDFFHVATTAAGVGLAGLDYLQLTFTLGSTYANKTFKLNTWSWDSAFNTNNDSSQDDYASWGVVNPSTNGGYHVTMWDDPATTDVNEAGLRKNNVPILDRQWMFGRPWPAESDAIDGHTFATDFVVTTDGTGKVTIYGWWDGDRWQGSYHFPINGLKMVPEPTTVALLGLGGLALLRRRK